MGHRAPSLWHSFQRGTTSLGKSDFGTAWQPGDVVGVAADMESGTLSYSVNGSFEAPNGAAFEGVACAPGGVFPALSGQGGLKVRCNFGGGAGAGLGAFRFAPPSDGFVAVADCFRAAAATANGGGGNDDE